MAPEQTENREIWKRIEGAERLFEIYKYFPTFHDARIRNIEINFERREFSLTVDYSDLIGESDQSLETRFTICRRNVQKADFNWYSEDLTGLEFSSAGNFIKTIIEDHPSGFEGEIISGEIQVAGIEFRPGTPEFNTIGFSIR